MLAADEALEADVADVWPLVGVNSPMAGHVRLPLEPDVTNVTFESAAGGDTTQNVTHGRVTPGCDVTITLVQCCLNVVTRWW